MQSPDSNDSPQTSPPPALVKALRQALRPLLRVMLARGITLPYFTELIKALLVEVAESDFRLDGKPVTDSRVSLLTGVHRKDVNRLRHGNTGEDDGTEKIPPVVSLGAQLVAQWLGNPQFLNADGQPLPLPRNVSEGGAQSFEALVTSINSDIRSRVVLDEWLRLGVVNIDDQRMVCLNTQAFVPARGFDEKAFYFGHNLHDHAAAAAHNLLGQEPPFLERSLHFNGLSAAAVAELAAQSQKLGMQALVAVNKAAVAREAREAPEEGAENADTPAADALAEPLQRMTFGIYFYSEPAAPAVPEPDANPHPSREADDDAKP
jgi:Family of unknown function (DUF6502)